MISSATLTIAKGYALSPSVAFSRVVPFNAAQLEGLHAVKASYLAVPSHW